MLISGRPGRPGPVRSARSALTVSRRLLWWTHCCRACYCESAVQIQGQLLCLYLHPLYRSVTFKSLSLTHLNMMPLTVVHLSSQKLDVLISCCRANRSIKWVVCSFLKKTHLMFPSINKDQQLIRKSRSQGKSRYCEPPLYSSLLTTADRHTPVSAAHQLCLGLWAHQSYQTRVKQALRCKVGNSTLLKHIDQSAANCLYCSITNTFQ